MARIGIFYASETGTTENVARRIQETFGEDQADCLPIGEAEPADLTRYDFLVLGTPTYAGGDLPDEWKSGVRKIERVDLSGRKVAVFGLGDQASYPRSFVDAMAFLARSARNAGAEVVGEVPSDGYSMAGSAALDTGRPPALGTEKFPPEQNVPAEKGKRDFVGLALDEEHQPERTGPRIEDWVRRLREEFR